MDIETSKGTIEWCLKVDKKRGSPKERFDVMMELLQLNRVDDYLDLKACRKLRRRMPRQCRNDFDALLYAAYLWGFTNGKIKERKIQDGKMVWDEEWQMWVDKPNEGNGE